MISNNVCPGCKYNEETENKHDIPVREIWGESGLEGYEYDCPRCGHVWFEE